MILNYSLYQPAAHHRHLLADETGLWTQIEAVIHSLVILLLWV